MAFLDIFLWYDLHRYDMFDVYSFCSLLRDVGKFEKGENFAQIYFNSRSMHLEFFKHLEDDEPIMIKKFVLQEDD